MVLVVGLLGLGPASADETNLESRLALAAAARLGLRPAPNPRGRRIAFVRIVREDVFRDGEGPLSWLRFANALHGRTRERVVRRELLLAEGDRWDERLARETERNLRARGIFALVRVLAVRAPGLPPDEVGLFVYVRDLWSLRLEHAFRVTGSVVDELYVQLAERNLAGLALRTGVYGRLTPRSGWLGAWLQEPRLGSEALGDLRLALLAWGEVQVNRDGGLEGGRLQLAVGRPYYDLGQRWSWTASAGFSDVVVRQLRAGSLLAYDVPETPERERLGRAWRASQWRAEARLTRRGRHGWARPSLSAGGRLRRRLHEPTDESSVVTNQQRAAFARDVLPADRAQLGPLLRYELRTTRYAEALELDSFARREPYELGPRLWAEAFFALPLGAGWERGAVLQAGGELAARWASGGVVRGRLRAGARLEAGRVLDERLRVELLGASPRLLGAGRLAGRLLGDWRRRDTSRSLVSIGGDDGLRGLPSQAFGVAGGSRMLASLEFRSRPLELWSVHLGLVAFVDVASVYERLASLQWHYAAGLGLRLLLPQFNRRPYRFDLGWPVAPGGAPVPSLGDGQAFEVLGEEP